MIWFLGFEDFNKPIGTYRIQGYEYQNPPPTSILYNHQSRDSLRTTTKVSSVGDNDQEETKTPQTTPPPGPQSFLAPSVFSRSEGISNEIEEPPITLRGSAPPPSSRLNIPKKAEYDKLQAPDVVKDEVDTYVPKEIKVKEIKEKESYVLFYFYEKILSGSRIGMPPDQDNGPLWMTC